MRPLPEVESMRFRAATSVCAIRARGVSFVGACREWPSIESPIVAAGAGAYERRLDFPACDPAAAGRYDRRAGSMLFSRLVRQAGLIRPALLNRRPGSIAAS